MAKTKDVFDRIDYGKITLKIDKLMETRGITVYELSNSAMIKFHITQKYVKGGPISRVDLDVLSRIMFALGTDKISDVLEYSLPERS